MTAITANDLDREDGDKGLNPLRKIAYSTLALAVLAIAATTMTAPAEAGSCTGYAALENPLLPVVV
jgi:hypothetical protein